jgi:His/Glu/Gln/Arg/opine family amino acid ABC transporter permease subunit
MSARPSDSTTRRTQLGGFGQVLQYWPFLAEGLRWTIQISLIAMAGGFVLGLLVALARVFHVPVLSQAGSLYCDFFRATPVLAQLVWIYYALPILTGRSMTAVAAGSIGLSLYAGSFLAEIFRAGILSIDRGQTEASLALGMTRAQSMRRVILPQALVRMLPPIGSCLVTLVKDSSLLTVIAVPELMRQSETLASITFRRMEVLTIVAVIYFALTYPIARGVDYLHRRLATD